MSVYQKLFSARNELAKSKFAADKPGFNFKYMDLPQIESAVTEVCSKTGLLPLMNFEDGNAVMTIIDTEEEGTISFTVPVSVDMVRINDKQPIQNLGGLITYMRRYLYMMAFAISEHDAVEEKIAEEKRTENAEELGKQIAEEFQKPEVKTFSEEEMKERCDMIDYFVELDPQAVEKILDVKKVSSVDELDTAYLRKVYNAKKKGEQKK